MKNKNKILIALSIILITLVVVSLGKVAIQRNSIKKNFVHALDEEKVLLLHQN